jgi:hypothetical protein
MRLLSRSTATLLSAAFLTWSAPTTAHALNPACQDPSIGNLVKNCSFEGPKVPSSGGWQFTNTITDWTSSSGHFERWFGHDAFSARDGKAHLELDVDFDANGSGKVANTTIWQTIETQVGWTYNVFFSVTHRRKNANDGAFSQVGLMVDLTGAPIASDDEPHKKTAKYFNDQSYQALTSGDWKDYLFQFTATGTSTTIGFRALGTPNEFGDHLDNIGVVAASQPAVVSVPEPASLGLLLTGLGLAAAARRRRSRNS